MNSPSFLARHWSIGPDEGTGRQLLLCGGRAEGQSEALEAAVSSGVWKGFCFASRREKEKRGGRENVASRRPGSRCRRLVQSFSFANSPVFM